MRIYELEKYVGQKIRYDIPPDFLRKERLVGVGVLRRHAENWEWRIEMPDEEFLLEDDMLDQIEYDKDDQLLTLLYIP